MALSHVEGVDRLFLGGLWALQRSDLLTQRGVTHVLSLVSFDPSSLKNFKNEPFSEYGKHLNHLLIHVNDVENEDILIHFPRAIQFIDEGLSGTGGVEEKKTAIFVHCASGKSRSVCMVLAYLLWKYPDQFKPGPSTIEVKRSRKETATEAVISALKLVRRSRPMADPNEGFMQQLALWWEWNCTRDIESLPAYQRWAYQREVSESVRLGLAPARFRFEDEFTETDNSGVSLNGPRSLRCKKCRHMLATDKYILRHPTPASIANLDSQPFPLGPAPEQTPIISCHHVFIEALSWMRTELEKGQLSGRLNCPNVQCGAGVGRYDWKGFRCTCGTWLTPAFSLQKGRIDEEVPRPAVAVFVRRMSSLGIRTSPGPSRGSGEFMSSNI